MSEKHTRELVEDSLETLKHTGELDPNTSFLTSGGEHLVFTVDAENRQRGVIVKVNHGFLLESLRAQFTGKSIVGFLDRFAKKLSERQQALEDIFGNHALKEYIEVRDVPISAEIANKLFAELGVEHSVTETVFVQTIVRVQERVLAETLEASKSIRGAYVERYCDSENYRRLQAMLFDGTEEFNQEFFSAFVKDDTVELLRFTKKDVQLKELLKDFVRRAIEFTKKKGDSLDLIGSKNVIVFKNQDDLWDYRLVDPIAGDDWQSGKNQLQKMFFIGEVRFGAGALNSLNYARTINGMAIWLGLYDRIDLSDFHRQDQSFAQASEVILDALRNLLQAKGRAVTPDDKKQLHDKTKSDDVTPKDINTIIE